MGMQRKRLVKVSEEFNFPSMMELKRRVQQIMLLRQNGEALDKESSDFKLVMALLSHHPRGAAKKENLESIIVDESSHGQSRCFFVKKADGTKEDFSCIKIYAAIEGNA